MDDTDCLTQVAKKCLYYREKGKKRQMALKSTQNYINQLKFHFDLDESDVVKILKQIVREKNKDNFYKKVWNIFN